MHPEGQEEDPPLLGVPAGEYGITTCSSGVPVKLGAKGVEQIIQITLTPAEQELLNKSAAAVKSLPTSSACSRFYKTPESDRRDSGVVLPTAALGFFRGPRRAALFTPGD